MIVITMSGSLRINNALVDSLYAIRNCSRNDLKKNSNLHNSIHFEGTSLSQMDDF